MLALILQGFSFSATAGGSVNVSAAEFGKEWPFTVSSGMLICKDPGAVYFAANGKIYPINGIARADRTSADVREIWKDDTEVNYPSKINIGPVISRGLALCR